MKQRRALTCRKMSRSTITGLLTACAGTGLQRTEPTCGLTAWAGIGRRNSSVWLRYPELAWWPGDYGTTGQTSCHRGDDRCAAATHDKPRNAPERRGTGRMPGRFGVIGHGAPTGCRPDPWRRWTGWL